MKLEFDGPGTLGVVAGAKRLASVDTRTLRLKAKARPRRESGDGPG